MVRGSVPRMPDVEKSVVAGLPGWVGRRVVVRHLLPDARASDALGTLLAVGPTTLVVRRDRLPAGTVEADRDIEVGLVDVLLARLVPPPALRRSAPGRR